uniref:Uncharacterized protein n=1 Tax=Anguilla anguilla TaxID=7936 RepID=A0A0E9SUT4_ANGAN
MTSVKEDMNIGCENSVLFALKYL